MICPTCRLELRNESIGGDRSNGSKPALLCDGCNTVWPSSLQRLLGPNHDRRDLA